MLTLIDANLLVSFLLAPQRPTAAAVIVSRITGGQGAFIISEVSIAEVLDVTQRKPYLRQRINQIDVNDLIASVVMFAEVAPRLSNPIPRRCRDSKDDYLLETAKRYEADIIVSGDKDMQILDPFEGIRILSPAAFLGLVASSNP